MNYSSPLSKDTRQSKKPKEEEVEKFKSEKPKISIATTKKVLKPLKLEVGQSECRWLNQYVENWVRGSCLPLALLSNDFLAELEKTFGVEGSKDYLDKLRKDFVATSPKGVVLHQTAQ